jgi:hypothetical protein
MATTKDATDAVVALQTAEAEVRVAEISEIPTPEAEAYPAYPERADAYTDRGRAALEEAGLL